MKKVFFSAAVIFIAAISVSCNKTRTCECTMTMEVMGMTQTQTVTGEHDGKCSELDASTTGTFADAKKQFEEMGGSVSMSCKEK